MKKSTTSRRTFVKASALGFGGMVIDTSPVRSATVNVDQKKHILCIGAHPGDPEFGCGGTLARYSAAGHRITILYLTRGEAYDPSQSAATSAALRTAEAETACKILNATPAYAGQIDGASIFDNQKSEEITKQILALKPDVVFTQWPLDTHKDHQIAGALTLQAWAKSRQAFPVYFYEVNTGDETLLFNPTDYVDITAFMDKKKASLMAHKTQQPQEVYDGWFNAMENFRGLEAGVKSAEAFVHLKPKAGRALLAELG